MQAFWVILIICTQPVANAVVNAGATSLTLLYPLEVVRSRVTCGAASMPDGLRRVGNLLKGVVARCVVVWHCEQRSAQCMTMSVCCCVCQSCLVDMLNVCALQPQGRASSTVLRTLLLDAGDHS